MTGLDEKIITNILVGYHDDGLSPAWRLAQAVFDAIQERPEILDDFDAHLLEPLIRYGRQQAEREAANEAASTARRAEIPDADLHEMDRVLRQNYTINPHDQLIAAVSAVRMERKCSLREAADLVKAIRERLHD